MFVRVRYIAQTDRHPSRFELYFLRSRLKKVISQHGEQYDDCSGTDEKAGKWLRDNGFVITAHGECDKPGQSWFAVNPVKGDNAMRELLR